MFYYNNVALTSMSSGTFRSSRRALTRSHTFCLTTFFLFLGGFREPMGFGEHLKSWVFTEYGFQERLSKWAENVLKLINTIDIKSKLIMSEIIRNMSCFHHTVAFICVWYPKLARAPSNLRANGSFMSAMYFCSESSSGSSSSLSLFNCISCSVAGSSGS